MKKRKSLNKITCLSQKNDINVIIKIIIISSMSFENTMWSKKKSLRWIKNNKEKSERKYETGKCP